jgi:hypothetical protein
MREQLVGTQRQAPLLTNDPLRAPQAFFPGNLFASFGQLLLCCERLYRCRPKSKRVLTTPIHHAGHCSVVLKQTERQIGVILQQGRAFVATRRYLPAQ